MVSSCPESTGGGASDCWQLPCPICLDLLRNPDYDSDGKGVPTLLDCGHMVHSKCINNWHETIMEGCPVATNHLDWGRCTEAGHVMSIGRCDDLDCASHDVATALPAQETNDPPDRQGAALLSQYFPTIANPNRAIADPKDLRTCTKCGRQGKSCMVVSRMLPYPVTHLHKI